MKRLKLYILFAASIFAGTLNAQEQERVGLVLSGGGAKGLAHVGVIKALEENDIPIDYITGTSMGAIVGGLYAIGYSPDDMIKLFSSKEFKTWYTGSKEEAFTNYSQKMDPEAEMITINFDFKDGKPKMQMPTNIVPTYQMDIAFLELFAGPNAVAKENFDSLFVPFRSVSSDINHKQPYVPKSGDLGTAIRASLSFPLAFKPVMVDSMLLFDGGIYNNFPQDIMIQEFKPDFVIGSKCANNSLKADEEDLVLQIENMVMRSTDYSIDPQHGILIESKFTGVSLLAFDRVQEFVKFGYENTLQKIDSIKERISARRSYEELCKDRQAFRDKEPKLTFNWVNVNGKVNDRQVDYLKQIFRGTKRKPFNFDRLKSNYFKIIGSETVSTIFPTASKDSASSYFDLNLKVNPAPRFRVSIGGNISSSNAQEGYLGLEYRTWRRLQTVIKGNLYYGKLYGSGLVGLRQDIPIKHTIFYELFGIYNRYDYYSGSPEIFVVGDKPSYIKTNDYHFRAALGFAASNNTPVKFTYTTGELESQYYQETDFSSTDVSDKSKIRYHTTSFTLERNTLNHSQFPTAGHHILIAGRYIHSKENYKPGTTSRLPRIYDKFNTIWAARFYDERYFRIGNRFSLGYMVDAVYSTKIIFANYLSTVLMSSAFQPTVHSKTIFVPEYRSNAYLAGGIMPTLLFTDRVYLNTGVYSFIPYKDIVRNPDHTASFGDPINTFVWSGHASLVWDTPFGPLSFSVNYYDKKDHRFYFLFNFGFLLFNRNGIEY
ncbi:MAG: patatin-like phospholipase family protein [Prevotellaceae bacterium]|jgi:NTE family protein|nr:patatin-like phospholipase family protein [Prevotellaceae bacterium]